MTSTFGLELRAWRVLRGLSQMELATRAGVSQRHISFLETGRSRPSREMVLQLATALEVPPREQNTLLAAGGHAAAYSEMPLDSLPGPRDALVAMLDALEPNIAFVVDRHRDVIASNAAAGRFMAWAFPDVQRSLMSRTNLSHLGLWNAVQSHAPDSDDPIVPMTYIVDGQEISFFTTTAFIGAANDLTLSEARIVTLWPADGESAGRWSMLLGGVGEPTMSVRT